MPLAALVLALCAALPFLAAFAPFLSNPAPALVTFGPGFIALAALAAGLHAGAGARLPAFGLLLAAATAGAAGDLTLMAGLAAAGAGMAWATPSGRAAALATALAGGFGFGAALAPDAWAHPGASAGLSVLLLAAVGLHRAGPLLAATACAAVGLAFGLAGYAPTALAAGAILAIMALRVPLRRADLWAGATGLACGAAAGAVWTGALTLPLAAAATLGLAIGGGLAAAMLGRGAGAAWMGAALVLAAGTGAVPMAGGAAATLLLAAAAAKPRGALGAFAAILAPTPTPQINRADPMPPAPTGWLPTGRAEPTLTASPFTAKAAA